VDDREHGDLAHLPRDAAPAVFAARADVRFAPPTHADQLELTLTRFVAALSGGLAEAGCTLVGHIKGTIAAPHCGGLTFHATTLTRRPELTGGLAGQAKVSVLTVNVIVFGVDGRALPGVVTDAWSAATQAETVWRR